LSNQKVYGIWGKYARPYGDMKIEHLPGFKEIMKNKFNSFPYLGLFRDLVDGVPQVNTSILKEIACIFNINSPAERRLYRSGILLQPSGHIQTELFHILDKHRGYKNFLKNFSLYRVIEYFNAHASPALQIVLSEVKQTERVICPLNRIFRILQTKPYWRKKDIVNNKDISILNNKTDYSFLKENKTSKNSDSKINNIEVLKTIEEMNASFSDDNWQTVAYLIKRNSEVSKSRNSLPWAKIKDDQLFINSYDGAHLTIEFDINSDFDNNYFFISFLNLYNDIS